MAEERKVGGEDPPTQEEMDKFIEDFFAGVKYSVEAMKALHKAGLRPGGKHAFLGLLVLAFGIGHIGQEQTPEQFGAFARVVAELAMAQQRAATPEKKAWAWEEAKRTAKELGIEIGKVH